MKKINLVALISILIGTVLEWYDFSLIASMAPIMSLLFFPSKEKIISLLVTYGVFASGFLMRPIGAMIFGHIGDKYGRNIALSMTIVLMVLPTTLMGLLPTFNQIGILAPITLIILRLVQGIASSGEYPGAICYLTEIAPKGKRGLWGSISMFGVVGGVLLGSIVNSLLLTVLSTDQLYSWGWRIPFLVGLPLGVMGLILRYRVQESQLFEKMKLRKKVLEKPLKNLVVFNYKNVTKVISLFSLSTISFYMSFVYIGNYLVNEKKISLSDVLLSNSISTVFLIFLIPLFGFLSDKIKRKYLMLAGTCSLIIFYYPIFNLFLSNHFSGLLFGQILIAISIAMLVGPMAATVSEMFPTSVRYSGVSAGLNFGASFFGGTSPFVATYLVQCTLKESIPAIYPILFALICFFVIMSIKDEQSRVFAEND